MGATEEVAYRHSRAGTAQGAGMVDCPAAALRNAWLTPPEAWATLTLLAGIRADEWRALCTDRNDCLPMSADTVALQSFLSQSPLRGQRWFRMDNPHQLPV